MSIKLDLNDAIFALSDALDLVGIDEVAHGKRVGYMAFKCAETMGFDKTEREYLFNLGLLHDIGVSSTQVHSHLVSEMQWQHDEDHAITGERLLALSQHLAPYSAAVRFHHTPWAKLQQLDQVPERVKFNANLVFLVDRVDALSAAHYNKDLQLQVNSIRQKIRNRGESLFSPEITEIFLKTSESDSFWLMLEPPHLDRFMIDMRAQSAPATIYAKEVMEIARIFARVVDGKSAFTFEHSLGVASLARYLCGQLGCDEETQDKVEIAGLLHDLGKLRIPDEILDNPGRLNATDTLTMHRHSFETYQVLREIKGLEDIALWAAYHHEKPNGSGYPFKRAGKDLSREARIIAVADVFQALAQNRPYRPAMPLRQIGEILADMASNSLLDASIVDFVQANADTCLAHAVDVEVNELNLRKRA